MPLSCKAILFDFDGVIIDSEPVYERHWAAWAKEHGASYEQIISIHHGIPAVKTISIAAPHVDAVYEADQFQLRCVGDLEGLLASEGVAGVLSSLPAEQWAIVTSSYRNMVGNQLKYLGLPQPDVLVAVEDVVQGKPAPEPYLKAAALLGVDPKECVVIEDSPAGIEAGKKAGAHVIGIATTKEHSELQQADLIIDRFAQLKMRIANGLINIETD